MAQELASQRFCTLTHYVQLSVDSVLVLHVHTLPENEDGAVFAGTPGGSSVTVGLPPPFSWLTERHMQELLVMVHEVVHEKAVRGLSAELPPPPAAGKRSGAAGTPSDLQLKRGTNVRALFHFKPNCATQHIVLPSDPALSPLLPATETFVNDRGRPVFESSGFSNFSGGGYRPFRAVQDSLHVFVDQYEPTSHHGVIKIMMLLDPGRKQSLDVLTYFVPNSKRESSSSGEGEGEGLLADLPVEGLKMRRRGGGGRRGGRGKSTTRVRSGNKNKTTSKAGLRGTRSVCGSHLQPTIVQSLADAKLTTRSSTTPRPSNPPPTPPQLPGGRQRNSSSDIDELFGMGPRWLSDNEEEEEDKETQNKDPGVSVDSSATNSGGRGSLSLSHTDTTLCGVANGENFTDVPPGPPIACPSSPATSSCMSFSTPSLDLKRRGDEVEMERRRDDGEIKGQGEEMVAGDSYRGEGAAEDRVQREVSPDLWSLDSGSQPLDDITNNMVGTSPPREQRKTFSPTSSQQDWLRGGAAGDETGEWAVIVIDSDDEEASEVRSASSQGSQGIEAQEKRKKRKRKVVSPETLFRGAKELRDVPERNVSRWLAQQKQLMVDIFKRRVYSRRHESFISGTRGRGVIPTALLHQISHHLFTKGQRDAITSGLMNAFCYKNMNLFSYVMSVLYPESLIRLIMDYSSISFEEAERKMMGLNEVLEMDSDV